MIRSSKVLDDFERWYASRNATQSYQDGLAIFTGLWKHARRLNPTFPEDWTEDVRPDIELARVLNGFPRKP